MNMSEGITKLLEGKPNENWWGRIFPWDDMNKLLVILIIENALIGAAVIMLLLLLLRYDIRIYRELLYSGRGMVALLEALI